MNNLQEFPLLVSGRARIEHRASLRIGLTIMCLNGSSIHVAQRSKRHQQ